MFRVLGMYNFAKTIKFIYRIEFKQSGLILTFQKLFSMESKFIFINMELSANSTTQCARLVEFERQEVTLGSYTVQEF